MSGGAESVIKAIIKSSKEEEFAVFNSSDTEFKESSVLGLKTFSSSLLKADREVERKDLEEQLEEIYKRFKPDIVYGHNLTYSFNPNTTKIINEFFKEKCPIIEHAHHAYIKKKEVVSETLNLHWDKVITVSKFAHNRIIAVMKDKSSAEMIKNGVDLDIFTPKERKEELKNLGVYNKHIFLFPSRPVRISTGEIGEQKQLRTVFKALSILKKNSFNDFCLITANFGSCHNNKESEIKESFNKELINYNLQDNVKVFPRDLEYEEMPYFYSLGDVVLFPALNESFGLVALEGMATGVPVIGAKSGGVEEIIENKKTGVLINPEDEEDLADKIEELISNKELYKTIRENGLKEVEEYNIKSYIEKIRKIWYSLL